MIRPFQFADIFLLQRMGRQTAKLDTVQALLQPQSAFWASLAAVMPWASMPWHDAKVTTYVLRQNGHTLIDDGFLQVQKRPGRPEVEIVALAPGLDCPRGHPAIWEKLLAHYNTVAAQQQVTRIYADVPDQPLPVHTFSHVGFRTYTRQTIWRLNHHQLAGQPLTTTAEIRQKNSADDWALHQLYARTVPSAVQRAEGASSAQAIKPPILEWWQGGACSCYVLEQRGNLVGAVQIVQGQRGYWLQFWTDFLDPNIHVAHQLLRHALALVQQRATHLPIYVAVREYHGALGALLADYRFAPFTDRAKMMRPVVQWVREPMVELVMEPSQRRVVTAPLIMPLPVPRERIARRGLAVARQLATQRWTAPGLSMCGLGAACPLVTSPAIATFGANPSATHEWQCDD